MQYQVRTGPLQDGPAPFSPEMVQGAYPHRARHPFKPQHIQPIGQITPVTAAFSFEMAVGYQPERARLLLGQRSPDTPFIDGPFFVSTIQPELAGLIDSSPRRWNYQRSRFALNVIAVPESVQIDWSYQPSIPRRLFLAPRIPQPLSHNESNPDSSSPPSTVGYQPARPRLFLAPRIPLPLFEHTIIQAAFSIEMTFCYHPDTSRAFKAPQQGFYTSDYPTVGAPVSSATPLLPLLGVG